MQSSQVSEFRISSDYFFTPFGSLFMFTSPRWFDNSVFVQQSLVMLLSFAQITVLFFPFG